MIRLFLARLLLTVLAVGSGVGIVWDMIDDSFTGVLPFRIELQGQQHVVRARAGIALPAPLAEGDLIEIRQMSVMERAALRVAPRIGTRLTLLVRRNNTLERVAVAVPPPPARDPLRRWQTWVYLTPLVAVLAMALLTLWRGRDAAAAWMSAFSFGLLFHNAPLMLSPALGAFFLVPLQSIIDVFLGVAVCGTAVSVARAGLPLSWRKVCLPAVVLLVLPSCVAIIADQALWLGFGMTLPAWVDIASLAFSTAPFGIAALTLLVGYAHAPPESRGRMRWILLSTGVLLAAALGNVVFSSYINNPALYAVSNVGLSGLALFGYLYAILRTRIVDVTVVIDRALVYSVLTAFVFGLFSMLEDAVHHLALGEQLSWIVQAAGALAVAAALSPVHRLLDTVLERVFFHKLRAMAAALRMLGKEAAFFESEEALMARVLVELKVPCAAAAIYERSGAVYVRRAADGEVWPGAVDADDPLFVSLRAGRQALDLKGRKSAAAAEGLAFPMAVGQALTGAVLVRLREGEQLDRELRGAVAELAQALGTSLYLLRYRELAALATEISTGQLDPEASRSRAAALAGVL